jgi:hypothetical protein
MHNALMRAVVAYVGTFTNIIASTSMRMHGAWVMHDMKCEMKCHEIRPATVQGQYGSITINGTKYSLDPEQTVQLSQPVSPRSPV